MRKRLFHFLLWMLPGISFCQKEHPPATDKLFDKAHQQIDDSMYSDAIDTYRQIMKISRPNTTPFGKACYNTGYVYELLNNYTGAKQIFGQILKANYNEMDRGGKGSGLMGEPYALYKHNACVELAEMSLREKDYKLALGYIRQFDEKYPYRHFCGNEIAGNKIYTAGMYARAFIGLGDTAEAIKRLLPHIFYNGLASNDEIVDQTVLLLLKKYDREFLLAELNKAIENMTLKQSVQGKYKYDYYSIVFLGVNVESPYISFTDLNSETLKADELTQRKIVAKQSAFYKKISE